LRERLECILQVDEENFTREMKKMAIDGHCIGLERSHNKIIKESKENCIKRIIQEEYERETDDLKKRLNVI